MTRALLFILLCVAFSAAVAAQESIVYESGRDGAANYRIPAIIRLKSGKLLAFAEARKNSAADFGDNDIVLKISPDNGRTWSAQAVVAENGELQASNSAPVVDELDPRFPNGRIFLFYNTGDRNEREVRQGKGKREVWYKTSTDEGRTWSDAVNITSQVKRAGWRAFANTPGHAIQLTRGRHRGRIFVPINYSKGGPQRDFSDYMAAGFYSDDHGKTFHIAADIGLAGSNEATAAELSNGDVLFNARNQKGDQKFRITALSGDGGETWGNVGFDTALPDPVCQGSLLTIRGKTIAFVNNADQRSRNNLTLRISLDDGRTWKKSFTVERTDDANGRDVTAYSDIAVLGRKTIGVLYERDDYKQIAFKAIKWK
ncbi:MAG: exo-alpha-sialidase [Acidobacteria bacterium OLB17]|nr:MAG: exo-alpha-sialidase [Acidobacteria bacterium OLB17]MCZ2390529.1 glycoside hydrolase [Acidobacteriota bacterium]